MVQKGDRVQRQPITFSDSTSLESKKLQSGIVVYVHPRGRVHVVQFGEGRRAVRESFPGVEK